MTVEKTRKTENRKAPWLAHYGEVPHSLEYPDVSMYELVRRCAEKYPNIVAYDFFGQKTTYKQMMQEIDRVAGAFAASGVKPNDRVTLCLPNLPQTVCCFYALNKIGAVANMVHPLSGEKEIAFFLRLSRSKVAVTMDQFYGKFAAIRKEVELPTLIVTSVSDAFRGGMKLAYSVTNRKNLHPLPEGADALGWKKFMAGGKNISQDVTQSRSGSDAAVILYSGGTTGTTKGILLSNLNFNALGLQTGAMGHCIVPGNAMLAVMPMFHGFGLGVCIHTMLIHGCRCILVPKFDASSYAKLLKKYRPNYIAGVPTLYEAILRNPDMEGVDLSPLMGVFSGGDSLSVELKKRFDKFLADHGAKVPIREGYGTTECVTASCLTPYHTAREGSIGLPFPDVFYKIVAKGTTEEVPYGEEGEICISGPTVMLEYIDNPQETADTLKRHADGHIWLHTGDLGLMDEDGFVYYRQRIKRMIISSGYNIYPSQLENVLDAHEAVHMSCVIGVKDPLKIQKVKAFVVLKPGYSDEAAVKASILAHCKKHLAKYAVPYEIEIRDDLPKTLVGKVAYRELEAEEVSRER